MPNPLAVLCLLLPLTLVAQTNPPGSGALSSNPTSTQQLAPPAAPETIDTLRARLLHQPLYFRVATNGTHLHYAADGRLDPELPRISFTVGGFDISSVDVKKDHLLLKGKRVGLIFPLDQPKRVILDQPVTIEIAASPSGQYGAALDRIFITDLADLIPTLPAYWQPYAQAHLAHIPTPVPKSSHTGQGATPPRLIHQVQPVFGEAERQQRISGTSTVHMEVGTNGLPTHIFVLKPAGLELDERVFNAVRQYVFSPATLNGTPIPFDVNIAVNVQIF